MMSEYTRISIAMAVYNGERFISEQLDSFVRQTRLPDELVVSDNASTDRTVEIVREFAARAPFSVRLFINERNLGVTKNFERAIRECTGDIIFLSDCDDVWYPDKIAVMGAALESNHEAAIALCNADIVNDELRLLNTRTWDRFHLTPRLRARLAAGTAFRYRLPYFGNSMALRGAMKSRLMPLPDSSFYARQGHDAFIAWVTTCSGMGGVVLVDKTLLAYRRHPAQMTHVAFSSRAECNYAHRRAWRARPLQMLEPILKRLDELGRPTDPRRVRLYLSVVRHLRARCYLPTGRLARLPTVASEMLLGGYQNYSSRRTLTAVRDLLLV